MGRAAVTAAVTDAATAPPAVVNEGTGGRRVELARVVTWLAPAWLVVGEVLVSLAAALVSVALAGSIVVNPLDRIGQVSGLAGLGYRYLVLGLAVLGVLAACTRWAPPAVASAVRALACAAVAGLVTGLVAGGLVVALQGTTWPLFADNGDARVLAGWAEDVLAGRGMPANYPPAIVDALAGWTQLTGEAPAISLKALQIGGAALFGPFAYLAWRLVLTPVWALILVLVAAMPLMELYKPHTTVVLVLVLPLCIRLLGVLRGAHERPWSRLVLWGVGGGASLGALFLVYSGWFLWSAPGVLLACAAVFPWRRAPGRAAVMLVAVAASFFAVSAQHLIGLLTASGTVVDRYFYFDTYVEPAYIAMWRNDLPGPVGPWPPPGEFAGMGIVSALLAVGLGVALLVGWRRTEVLVLAACLAGAWVLRLYLASRMWADQAVQLYPRTTAEILFCLLALGVLAIMISVRGALVWFGRLSASSGPGTRGAPPVARTPTSAGIAVIAAALLAGLFMGSATADRYMPRDDGSAGYLAFVSHHVRQLNGTCGAWVPAEQCRPNARDLDQPHTR